MRHYVDNILPNGFKAQVVCHSKLACVRYQSGIEAVLAECVAGEQAKQVPDAALLRKLAFLKTAVVVSSDGTNEAAIITLARKQAVRMNAVENFRNGFDLDAPDAPVEQVMYIDKRLREHSLLQAIAHTNRVKRGKQRG